MIFFPCWLQSKSPFDYLSETDRGLKTIGDIVDDVICYDFNNLIWLTNPTKYRLGGDRDWYREVYLKSDHWQQLRRRKLEGDGVLGPCNHCEVCGRPGFEVTQAPLGGEVILDIHHKTYVRLGFELMDDLEVLCRDCHNSRHTKVTE